MKAKKTYQKKKKRLGRGIGSGRGKTSGRGHKGQRARSGYSFRPGFEGGQNPLYRRLPKRGFNNAAFRTEYAVINLDRIAALDEKEVTPETLLKEGILSKKHSSVKILGNGNIKKPVIIKAHRFSESAKKKIEQAGGQAVLIES